MVAFVIQTRRANHAVRDHKGLWQGRDYACPGCEGTMLQGWAQVARGIDWSPRKRGRPRGLTGGGDTLPNTQSMHLRVASNMAWRCPKCGLVLIDHSKMVN